MPNYKLIVYCIVCQIENVEDIYIYTCKNVIIYFFFHVYNRSLTLRFFNFCDKYGPDDIYIFRKAKFIIKVMVYYFLNDYFRIIDIVTFIVQAIY